MASADLHIFHLCLRIVVKNVGDRLSTTIQALALKLTLRYMELEVIQSRGRGGEGGHFYSPLSTIEWDTIKTSSFKQNSFAIINITILNSLLVFVFLFRSFSLLVFL